jgi:hypothetical protein
MTVGVEPETVRKSGRTGAQEDSVEASKEMPRDMNDALPDEEVHQERTPKFMRMRYQWRDDERAIVGQVNSEVDRVIQLAFGDAYRILNEIFDIIREPEIFNGVPVVGRDGLPIWKRNVYGDYVEDFSRMTRAQLSDLFGRITLRLVAWEQEAAQIRGMALFSKAQFEERYAIAYDEPLGRVTVEGRQAIANADAAEERYHAVFRTMISHRADSMVKSMERVSQRLKDALVVS